MRYGLRNERGTRHAGPRTSLLRGEDGDPNDYILGEITGHSIVIACLLGKEGKSAAAIVATNLSRTFPSIKWWFLVGTAGGVPNPHDIRLGDVVISMPEGQHGGVVQYDLGKDTDTDFLRKGFLWPPPSRLRSAVETMRSDHLFGNSKIEDFLAQMFQKWPRLAAYTRPSNESDVLYRDDYPHVSSAASCVDCDLSHTVDRPLRQSESSVIHYGLIASGDSVVKSAAKRSAAIRSLGDVLCFEMEAAGLMTNLSCIVIRGISNYADSHKNDKWNYFASAAAAACTKELLSYLDAAVDSVVASPTGAVAASDDRPPASYNFNGTGIQHSGSGNFSAGNIHIG